MARELDGLQASHPAYRAELRQRGALVTNGPFDQQSDPSHRGMSIFTRDPGDARGPTLRHDYLGEG